MGLRRTASQNTQQDFLGPHLGQSEHHVINHAEFLQTLDALRITIEDIIVFDIICLFTNVPIVGTLKLLSNSSK